MRSVRKCSRTGCHEPAVATLTYAYGDSTAVVGPLATSSEPHSYDLCEAHAMRLTVPRGWEVVRHEGEFSPPEPTVDELTALAEAVREAGRPEPAEQPAAVSDRSGEPGAMGTTGTEPGRRGHLRVLPGHA
ncbi:DUF3499 domain-containing protein [Prauserella alba]|uniref:DUF3499 domain-containing protein n=1 Tax=Prauserella alba TaxID=176898 RepID=A0ABN1VNB9_9PSEU|nr:DUF3499 domain-containing protein [Prauserella alba]MCP2181050.1 Protein of unknown function (DUF3499) [Prauserella alba]